MFGNCGLGFIWDLEYVIWNFDMAEGPYNPVIMDHLAHPRNIGELEDPDGVAEAKNPACGDTMRLFIKVQEERIVDARFLTFGCGPAIAASSIATEMLKGKTIEESLKISNQVVSDALGGLPPTKIHCAHLAEKAIQAVVWDYQKRKKEK